VRRSLRKNVSLSAGRNDGSDHLKARHVRFKKIETLTSGTGLVRNQGIFPAYQRAEYDISFAVVRIEYSVMTMALAHNVSFHSGKSPVSMIITELIERVWRYGLIYTSGTR